MIGKDNLTDDMLEILKNCSEDSLDYYRNKEHNRNLNRLLMYKLIYVAVNDGKRYVHLTPRGKDALRVYGNKAATRETP